MWLVGDLLAAEAPANDSLIVVVGGIVVAAIGAMGLVLTEVVKGRAGRTTPAPPGPAPQPQAPVNVELYERTAVLSRRADDSDTRDDVQDRRHEVSEDRHDHADARLESLEQWRNRIDPDWRRDG